MITIDLSLPREEVDAICVEARRRRHARETTTYRSTPAGRAKHIAGTQRWVKSEHGSSMRRAWKDQRRADLDALKTGQCADCGNHFPAVCMDFDHRPGETKTSGVADLMLMKWEKVLAEIAKCDLVCACCHRIRTFKRVRGGS